MLQQIAASRPLRRMGVVMLTMALGTGAAEACRRAPEQQIMSPDRQRAFARDVPVAGVVSALPAGGDTVAYRFVVLKRLAGPAPESFTLRGIASDARFASPRGEAADHDGRRAFRCHRQMADVCRKQVGRA